MQRTICPFDKSDLIAVPVYNKNIDYYVLECQQQSCKYDCFRLKHNLKNNHINSQCNHYEIGNETLMFNEYTILINYFIDTNNNLYLYEISIYNKNENIINEKQFTIQKYCQNNLLKLVNTEAILKIIFLKAFGSMEDNLSKMSWW